MADKNTLQEWLQQRALPLPEYSDEQTAGGVAGQPVVWQATVQVRLRDGLVRRWTGEPNFKKLASHASAARRAYEALAGGRADDLAAAVVPASTATATTTTTSMAAAMQIIAPGGDEELLRLEELLQGTTDGDDDGAAAVGGQSLGYRFRNLELLRGALTHRSLTNETGTGGSGEKGRMQWLGDAVLKLVISERLYAAQPAAQAGALTAARQLLEQRATLAAIARNRLQLHRHLRFGKGMRDQDPSNDVIAEALEAVIGAVFLDGGIEAARRVWARLTPLP